MSNEQYTVMIGAPQARAFTEPCIRICRPDRLSEIAAIADIPRARFRMP